ncbi:MAG: bifunctional [glutamine synthetase] adenylyltransferase/[glutamine synthetase]-adenylyl-L-tyrosine phosphorylase, partial [Rhodospirillaceae bacterium]|nr:bifunctional [glutamine synthetase] adenylyltransferase/[glutamine synthetase]-adenylyl-L-tyrosine phosphorylase [Rhodospirillaceae bacterium]
MHFFRAASEQNMPPKAASVDRAALGIERWVDAVGKTDDAKLVEFADSVIADSGGKILLEGIFGNSPYLSKSAAQEPGFFCRVLEDGPEPAFQEALDMVSGIETARLSYDKLATTLRQAKRRAALAIGIADITNQWPLEKITRALSDFADTAVSSAVSHLLLEADSAGAFELADRNNPEQGSGLVILGLGKLGSHDLNYSSDIDLIILYDTERIKTERPDELQTAFVRLTRNLVKLLDERTADGYVFRTDLRLRPDPGSTPPALSVLAAVTYYESIGQNWERAAMIKARPIAGDRDAGAAFLEWLVPFIWRKNLDFAAIQDIHSIKRQIDAHHGGENMKVAGHNVKLGRGGIREIEFYAQTQQLIWGGRSTDVRAASTEQALQALTDSGQVSPQSLTDMISAYRFLRRVEHRLQMIDDKQTHSLPEDPDALNDIALFLGYDSIGEFAPDLTGHLQNVETHYAKLFDDAPSLGAADDISGNLVFTGGDIDPDTISTLERLGFTNGEAVDETVRGWHHGRYRAMRSSRSRELLTELLPVILKAFSVTPDPDATFMRFDEFLSRLPSGVQLFSMFYSNPGLLDLVAEIMGGAPRLAEHLSRRPQVLDSVLTADFFEPPPPREAMVLELDMVLGPCRDLEDILLTTRRWAHDRRFHIGVQSLTGKLGTSETAHALSDVADTCIARLFQHVHEDFASRHGQVSGADMAVIAMGKLGSRELTSESDLDLIFVYNNPEQTEASDGNKPLVASQYFARLGQNLISALTAQTSEGDLYEVDMRLRPSGTAGPIATSLQAYRQYNQESAWTWEQMALTRSRMIAGSPELGQAIDSIVGDTLMRERDPDQLLTDVADMRRRIDREHHTEFIWDVKHLRGGLVDVEFISQYLQLRHAHADPEVLSANTRNALEKMTERGILDKSVADDLIEACDLWRGLQVMLRLTIPRELRKKRDHEIPESLSQQLAAIG